MLCFLALSEVILDVLEEFLSVFKDYNYFYWQIVNSYSHGAGAQAYLQLCDEQFYKFIKKHFENGTTVVYKHTINLLFIFRL